MARWRLLQPHYLNIAGNEWEYKETSRETGKQATMRIPVPMHLDPNNPSDHNYPGDVIVADKPSKQYNKDYIFTGPPTPDMEPLDEEAEAITAEWQKKWIHPIEALPNTTDASMVPLDVRRRA